MPKFIYTIVFILVLNLLGIYFVITKTEPDLVINKVIFSILVTFLFAFLLPFTKVLFSIASKGKEDLNQVFKNSFKKNLLISAFFGLIIFIKTIYYFNLTLLGLFITLLILGNYLAPVLRKSRKKPKY
jgi:hypothetical protein